MKGNLALCAVLLLPMAASADTVVMRDGRTYDGTFLSGNSRQLVLVDNSGVRRRFQVTDVQEMRFDTPAAADNSSGNYGTRNRTRDDGSVFGTNNGSYNGNSPTYGNVDEAGMLSRIREDIRSAMSNANLSSDQRRTLEDARGVLQQAANDFRNGYTVNYRDVRMALYNVQNLMNTGAFASQDQDTLSSDITQLRNVRADYGNSSNRDYNRR